MFTPSAIHTTRTGFGDNIIIQNNRAYPVANRTLVLSIVQWMWSIIASYRDYKKILPEKAKL